MSTRPQTATCCAITSSHYCHLEYLKKIKKFQIRKQSFAHSLSHTLRGRSLAEIQLAHSRRLSPAVPSHRATSLSDHFYYVTPLSLSHFFIMVINVCACVRVCAQRLPTTPMCGRLWRGATTPTVTNSNFKNKTTAILFETLSTSLMSVNDIFFHI